MKVSGDFKNIDSTAELNTKSVTAQTTVLLLRILMCSILGHLRA